MTHLAGHAHDLAALTWLDWTLVGLAALGVVWVIWRAVVLTVRPDEDDPNHIKRTILSDVPPPAGDDSRAYPGP